MTRAYKRNYWIHAIEGGFFIGGLNFISAQTVLPPLLEKLGASDLMIALMPQMILLGFMLPPLFTAHWMEGMSRYMPLLIKMGIGQRLPFLITGLALLWTSSSGGMAYAWLVFLTPLVSGVFGGITLPGWQQVLKSTVSSERLSSMIAIRYGINALIGLGAGFIVFYVLRRFDGLQGYGYLHLMAFGMTFISYLLFIQIKEGETNTPSSVAKTSLWDNLKAMPKLLAAESEWRYIIYLNGLRFSYVLVAPFLSIYILHSGSHPDEYLGRLVSYEMLGSLSGVMLAGFLGDRFGPMANVILGRALGVLFLGLLFFPPFLGRDIIVFVLMGSSFFINQVGDYALHLQKASHHKSNFFAMISLSSACAMILFSVLASVLYDAPKDMSILLWMGMGLSCLSLYLAWDYQKRSFGGDSSLELSS